jgi:hypothetical protein
MPNRESRHHGALFPLGSGISALRFGCGQGLRCTARRTLLLAGFVRTEVERLLRTGGVGERGVAVARKLGGSALRWGH